jgi:hypothetical protein
MKADDTNILINHKDIDILKNPAFPAFPPNFDSSKYESKHFCYNAYRNN